jgi:hypothetical protein
VPKDKDGQDFDCGVATPEFYDDGSLEALHVLNVNVIGDANRNRVLRFVCARVLHFRRHLPPGASQRIRFDLRGQRLSDRRLQQIRRTIVDDSGSQGIRVEVEFMTN